MWVHAFHEPDPKGLIENVGDALGLFTSQVERSVEQFKRFIERRGQESGAWRGEVDDGQRVR